MRAVLATILAAASLAAAGACAAVNAQQMASPIDDGGAQGLALQIQGLLPRAPLADVIVDGELSLPPSGLFARRLVFRPHGVIVIDGASVRPKQPVLIAAKDIVVEGPADGSAWIRVLQPVRAAAPTGATGSPGDDRGSREGQDGGPGGAGGDGQNGASGSNAPDLILVTESIVGHLNVDLVGGTGGDGGNGGTGGRGGAAGYGTSASQSLFDCKRGPGYGGRGGPGGPGGTGGQGGKGGNGGSLTLVATDPTSLSASLSLRSDPGAPGSGGVAGGGGLGGPGGRRGQETLPYCRQTASDGPPGAGGSDGLPGAGGSRGSSGSLHTTRETDLGLGGLW